MKEIRLNYIAKNYCAMTTESYPSIPMFSAVFRYHFFFLSATNHNGYQCSVNTECHLIIWNGSEKFNLFCRPRTISDVEWQ